MSRRVVIGIHGLGNKPEPKVLEDWWRASIAEGLARHLGDRRLKVRFELVYWADLLHPTPLEPDALTEPYIPAGGEGPLPRASFTMRRFAAGRAREGLLRFLGVAVRVPMGENFVHDQVRAKMPDLHMYRTDPEVRSAVQSRLAKRLRSARRWRRRVMLIAHSMGSIVAYDVLRDAGSTLKGLEVSHFVTVGSPLGLADLKTVVEGPLQVPECAAQWSNFSDPKDPVSSWEASLTHAYGPNSRGVTVSDRLVSNGYLDPGGKPNPHKIYGYLRTPEISELIAGFVR